MNYPDSLRIQSKRNGETMLAVLIKLTLISGLCLLLLPLLRDNSPVLRHRITFYCSLLCLILPLFYFSPVTVQFSGLSDEINEQNTYLIQLSEPSVSDLKINHSVYNVSESTGNGSILLTKQTTVAEKLVVLILSVWIIGMLVKIFRIYYQFSQLKLFVDGSAPYDRIRKIVLNSNRNLECRISNEIGVPLLYIGRIRKVILLPEKISSLSNESVDMIISHELCHYQRKDYLSLWMISLLEIIYWFHPFVLLLGKKHRIEMELACDYELIRQGMNPLHYAETLISFPKSNRNHSVTPAMSFSGKLLGNRIKLLLNGHLSKLSIFKSQILIIFFVLSSFVGCVNNSTLLESSLIELVSYDVPSLRAGELEKNNIVIAAFYDGEDKKNTFVELELSKKGEWSKTWVKLGPLEKFDKQIYTWHLKTVNGGEFTGKYKISGVIADGMVDGIAVGIISSNDNGKVNVHKSNGPLDSGISNILCSWPLDLDNHKFQRLVPQLKIKGSESIKRLLCGSQLMVDGIYSVKL